MEQLDERDRRIRELEERLALLTQASLRVNESLDLDTVLQEVVDSARALTASRYGAITIPGEVFRRPTFIVSGLTEEEHQGFWDMPGGLGFFEYLSGLQEPLRVADVAGHLGALGLPAFLPAVPVGPLLVAPIRHLRAGVGTIYLARGPGGDEFARNDEETLVMFAAQAAMAIANAQRHREEQRARAGLETLIDTSPVGVVVLDALTGAPASFNREAMRIVDGLRASGQSPVDLLEVVSFRRADGREFSLQEFPLAGLLSRAEAVHAEEIVLRVPGGASVTVLLNATPIMGEDGVVESVVVAMQDLAGVEELERLRAEFLAMVSHELRIPLSSIKGSATTILDSVADLDPAVVRQFVRIMRDQADHMNALVSDLLDVARIETGALPVNPEPAEVAALVDRARNAFRNAGRPRNHLEIDVDPGLPLVSADRRRIVQVLVNLLTNAARHSPESSVVRVSAVREGVYVAITVADQGRGIPAERLPDLFRKFSVAQSEEHGRGHRAGAGHLPGDRGGPRGPHPCRERRGWPGRTLHLHTAHGGYRRGRYAGSRILIQQQTAGRTGGTGQGTGGGRRPQRPAVRPRHPWSTRATCQSSPATRRRLSASWRQEKPELALLDLMLPDSDGIELMGAILGVADVPVIFLSAYGREDAGGPGPGDGGRRLRGQALLPHGAGGPDQGGPAAAGGFRTFGALRAGGPDHRLRPAAGDLGRTPGAPDPHRVRGAGGAVGPGREGGDPRAPAGTGLGRAGQRQSAAPAHDGGQAAPQAGRRRRPSHLHLHRADGWGSGCPGEGRADFPLGAVVDHTPPGSVLTAHAPHFPSYRRWLWSAAGTPSLLHTVTGPVTGPAKARSRVAVSMGRVPAAARKLYSPLAVSQTISRGRARPDAAMRR